MEEEVGSDGAFDTAGPPAVDPAPPKAKDVDLGSPVVDQVWSVIQLWFFFHYTDQTFVAEILTLLLQTRNK